MTALATRAKPATSPPPAKIMRRRRREGPWFGWVLVAPAAGALLLITAFPLVYNAMNSVRHVDLLDGSSRPSVGTENYRRLFSEHTFVPALEHTLGFTAVSVTLEVAVGLVLALLLNMPFRGRGLLRASLLIPWAVPTAVAATLWRNMFDRSNGFVDYLLGALHLPGAHVTWLANTWSSWVMVLVTDAWQSTPLVAILLLAGLQSVPAEVYEAGRIDGASRWQSFRYLTWPLLRPALMVAVVFRALSALLIFDVIYVVTGGGPGNSTETLSFVNYHAFLVDNNFGYGGAISISMLITTVMVALLLRRVLAARC